MTSLSLADPLLRPERLWRRAEVLATPCPIPSEPGVYAWYFTAVPDRVPLEGCHWHGNAVLLYAGISPKQPPHNGRQPSRQRLRQRVRYHLRGNAEGSTLRLTLGCLLSQALGIELRRVGSGTRRTFGPEGEARLSAWLEDYARVVWQSHSAPWTLEDKLIRALALPLNLHGNQRHPFHPQLTEVRSTAKRRADSLPILCGA